MDSTQSTRKSLFALANLFAIAATLLLSDTGNFTPSARAEEKSPAADPVAALKAEIEILKGKLPDQSHAMKDVGYHFANLWFAGQKQNWPLAKFYCDETRAHLKWAVNIIPVRKVKGGELDLRALLDGLDRSLFAA